MSGYLLDWGGLLVRWIHIITGIAWIGSSFYFIWLDNHLSPPESAAEPGVAGELWAAHGSGFYRTRKFQVAPDVPPRTLHWFYWDAYSTWLSGMGLLGLLYFVPANAYLIDPALRKLSQGAAVGIAVAMLIGGWLIYDGLCRSRLGRSQVKLGIALSVQVCVLAWALCALFSGRGAFILYGAALGTIMVANLYFVIIPVQREQVRARQERREIDPALGVRARQRSMHNTYFTLPVLFAMLSMHHPMTYGAPYKWLVLVAMTFSGVCIRGWFVLRHRPEGRTGLTAPMLLIMGLLALIIVIVGLYPDDALALGRSNFR